MSQEKQPPRIITIDGELPMDGSADLSNVQPHDSVAIQLNPNYPREILVPVGAYLSEDRIPLHLDLVEDGATKRLDGEWVVKLGGKIIGFSKPNSGEE